MIIAQQVGHLIFISFSNETSFNSLVLHFYSCTSVIIVFTSYLFRFIFGTNIVCQLHTRFFFFVWKLCVTIKGVYEFKTKSPRILKNTTVIYFE